jgi:hypothetical protein
LAFFIWHFSFDIWHYSFGIWHLAFGIWHLAFGIWLLAFGIMTVETVKMFNLASAMPLFSIVSQPCLDILSFVNTMAKF